MKQAVSARIDPSLVRYLDEYQKTRETKSRSEVLEIAIRALRERDLKDDYAAAMDEWERGGDAEAWNAVAGDGLERDEAW